MSNLFKNQYNPQTLDDYIGSSYETLKYCLKCKRNIHLTQMKKRYRMNKK